MVFQALQTREIMTLGVQEFGSQNVVIIPDWGCWSWHWRFVRMKTITRCGDSK
jgi:hypothetical protein